MAARVPSLFAVVVVFVVTGSLTACSEDRPERLLLVGDSIMAQTAPMLTQRFSPDVDVRNEAVSGSGLLTPSVFDWHGRRDRPT